MQLQELIDALETYDPSIVVREGFAEPHSYRGYYEQLAFEPAYGVTIGSMLSAARSAGWLPGVVSSGSGSQAPT